MIVTERVMMMADYINRADAIKAIDKQWLRGINMPICREVRTAIVQIISALPSAKPKGDLISRADVICEVLVNDGIDNIVDRINALPSAEAVQGEWHKTENDEMEITGYYCSVCDMPTDEPTNYCGNCGARMKGGAE